MRKFLVLVLALLFVDVAIAIGAPDGKEKNWIVRRQGDVFKLIYDCRTPGLVKVTIYDDGGHALFSEKLKSGKKGFVRPYNFSKLPEGDYRFCVTNDADEQFEIVSSREKIRKKKFLTNIQKLHGENRYLVAVPHEDDGMAEINIFNENNDLVYTELVSIDGGYASVFRLKDFGGPGVIQVKNLNTSEQNNFTALKE